MENTREEIRKEYQFMKNLSCLSRKVNHEKYHIEFYEYLRTTHIENDNLFVKLRTNIWSNLFMK